MNLSQLKGNFDEFLMRICDLLMEVKYIKSQAEKVFNAKLFRRDCINNRKEFISGSK